MLTFGSKMAKRQVTSSTFCIVYVVAITVCVNILMHGTVYWVSVALSPERKPSDEIRGNGWLLRRLGTRVSGIERRIDHIYTTRNKRMHTNYRGGSQSESGLPGNRSKIELPASQSQVESLRSQSTIGLSGSKDVSHEEINLEDKFQGFERSVSTGRSSFNDNLRRLHDLLHYVVHDKHTHHTIMNNDIHITKTPGDKHTNYFAWLIDLCLHCTIKHKAHLDWLDTDSVDTLLGRGATPRLNDVIPGVITDVHESLRSSRAKRSMKDSSLLDGGDTIGNTRKRKSKRNRKMKVKLDNDASLEDVIGAVNVIDKQLKNMRSVAHFHAHVDDNYQARAQFEGQPVKGNYSGGSYKLSGRIFNIWKARYMDKKGYSLNTDTGKVTVKKPGTYFIYAQVIFFDHAARKSAGIHVQDEGVPKMECLAFDVNSRKRRSIKYADNHGDKIIINARNLTDQEYDPGRHVGATDLDVSSGGFHNISHGVRGLRIRHRSRCRGRGLLDTVACTRTRNILDNRRSRSHNRRSRGRTHIPWSRTLFRAGKKRSTTQRSRFNIYHQCSMSGLVNVKKGEKVFIKSLEKGRGFLPKKALTYWGIIKVGSYSDIIVS